MTRECRQYTLLQSSIHAKYYSSNAERSELRYVVQISYTFLYLFFLRLDPMPPVGLLEAWMIDFHPLVA